MLRAYQRLLDSCEPYIIARDPVLADMKSDPLGIRIPDANIFNPIRVEGGVFINLVQHLDEMAYGPVGLSMPSWVFYDCAVIPGAVFGFAQRAADVPTWVRKIMHVPDDHDGLVPVSMFIAIPMASRRAHLIYTLCSLNSVAAGAAPEGLWRMTLAAGTECLGLDEIVGTAQWRSPRLGPFTGLGPLELLTAWTPAHDNYATCTFRVRADADARERLLRGDLVGIEGVDTYLDADDVGAIKALQDDLEAGLRVAVVGPAEIRGSNTRVPLQVLSGDGEHYLEPGPVFTRRFQG